MASDDGAVLQELQRLRVALDHARDGEGRVVATSGVSALDFLARQIVPGRVSVVLGPAGCGKRSLALRLVEWCALKRHGWSAIFSPVLSCSELTARLFGGLARVEARRVLEALPAILSEGDRVDHGLDDAELDRLEQVASLWFQSPLFVDCSPHLLVDTLCAKIAAAAPEPPDGGLPRLVVIDYVQMLMAIDRGETRATELATAMRSFKRTARDSGVHVLVISHLNRAGTALESEAITNDADLVVTLVPSQSDATSVWYTVDRDRFGPSGLSARLRFLRDIPRMDDPERVSDGE